MAIYVEDNQFLFGFPFSKSFEYDVQDKKNNAMQFILYNIARSRRMFKYKNLPDTIPERSIELYLQVNGHLAIAEVNGDLYAFTGGMGGERDPYYMPTLYTVANPALGISKMFEIGKDCEVISNDTYFLGLIPLYSRYAALKVETEISMRNAIVNTRADLLMSAADDNTKESAELFIKKLLAGDLSVIGDRGMFDEKSLSINPGTKTNMNTLSQLIEVMQYLKASEFNEIGLDANYNMKRESLNSTEAQMNDDALLPLVDDMFECRKIGIEKVNEHFGTNIEIEYASSWEDNEEEIEMLHDQMDGDDVDSDPAQNDSEVNDEQNDPDVNDEDEKGEKENE